MLRLPVRLVSPCNLYIHHHYLSSFIRTSLKRPFQAGTCVFPTSTHPIIITSRRSIWTSFSSWWFNQSSDHSLDMKKEPKFVRSKSLSQGGRKHVPLPTGEFKVIGCRDIMTGGCGRESGILGRLFYPAEDQSRDIRSQSLFWPNWLPHENYRKGFTDVARVTSPTALKVINWLVGDSFIPCVMVSRPLKEEGPFPFIIFSHGMGGCRTVHSGLCLELASHGYIVLSLEHRDGSACTTFYPEKVNIPLHRSNPDLALPTIDGMGSPMVNSDPDANKPSMSHMKTIMEEEEDSSLSSRRSNGGTTFYPKTTTQWIPHLQLPYVYNPDIYAKRNGQIRCRAREVSMALNVMERLNAGKDIGNTLDGLLDPKEFHNMIDTERVCVMGHSMGGATALLASQLEPDRIKVTVCLDTWMYPVKDEPLDLVQPVIFINSDKFPTKENLRKIRDKVVSNSPTGADRVIKTIKGSVHYNQTDIPFNLSLMAKFIFGGSSKRNKFTAHDLSAGHSLSFLDRHFGLDPLPVREGYLKRNQHKVRDGLPKKI